MLFSVGMSVAVSLYVIGFCETLVDQMGVITNDPINGICVYLCLCMLCMCVCERFVCNVMFFFKQNTQRVTHIKTRTKKCKDIRLYGCILTTILLGCVLIGIGWIIKLQFVLTAVLVIAILAFVFGAFFERNITDKPWILGMHVTHTHTLTCTYTQHNCQYYQSPYFFFSFVHACVFF